MSTLDPIVLFFLLGLLAGMARSELKLPPAIYDFVSIVLLLAIGLKGGVQLAGKPLGDLAGGIGWILVMGFSLPLVLYPLLRFAGRLPKPDAASLAAHYGSVSVGTFAVAIAYVTRAGIPYEEVLPLYVVLLEIPAIIVGIAIARGLGRGVNWRALGREVFLGKSIVLLLGGLAIGWIAGPAGMEPLSPLFVDLFKGVLALFLLEMGLIASAHLRTALSHGAFLLAWGLVMPPILAAVGLVFAELIGLSLGGSVLLASLAASASYIAAPAAMRTAVPEANPALSLAASLAITFPFNLLVGIPLYHRMATAWLGS